MKTEKSKSGIDWEARTYGLAMSIFFHDTRHCDMVLPENRLEQWPAHIRVAAEMAVEAAVTFVSEYRKSATPESMEDTSNAP